ncbi:MAG TPA: PRC-barrel domain-containing protein, partial [Nitrospira sp.]|nr:PRC-barrel domain-containing protein [Nitrospira sp.]
MRMHLAVLMTGGLLVGGMPALAQQNTQQQADGSSGTQPAQAGQSSSATAQNRIDLTTWAHAPLYDGWRATRLIDAEVISSEGEEMGEIHNIIFGPEGTAKAVIIEAGGFLDIGDTHIRLPWDQIEITRGEGDGQTYDYEASVRVPISEEDLEDFSLFDGEEVVTAPREWRATELIDDRVLLAGGVNYGYVRDLVIGQDGKLNAVVVNPDVAWGGPFRPYAYPWYGYDAG